MCSSTRNTKMAETPKPTRRSNKPLMERRRRERINHCLNELKNLVLTAQRKDPTRYSKLEKADILEMTVRHVQALHRNDSDNTTTSSRNSSSSNLGGSSPPSGDAATKYSAGFRKCASEVSRFLSSVNGLPPDLHARVLSHLSSATKAEYKGVNGQVIEEKVDAATTQLSKILPRQQQQHQSHSVPTAASGESAVEARLSSGQLALVVPTWTGVSIGGSPPTNATSPEAAGAPSSPESARGSPTMSTSSSSSSSSSSISEDHHGYDYSPNSDALILNSANRYYSISSSIASSSSISSSSSSVSSSVAKNSPYSSTTTVSTGGMQVDLQVAPLDLATSQRRPSSTLKPTSTCTTFGTPTGAVIPMRHRATTVSVESPQSLQQQQQQQQVVPFIVQRRGQSVSSCSKGHSKSSTVATQKGHIHHLQKEIRHAPYPAHNHQNPHWRPW